MSLRGLLLPGLRGEGRSVNGEEKEKMKRRGREKGERVNERGKKE